MGDNAPEGMERQSQDSVQEEREQDMTYTCIHCGRVVVKGEPGEYEWVDPEATGDDKNWRETCDSNDTFLANHEVAP
jgi:hypothetical protein